MVERGQLERLEIGLQNREGMTVSIPQVANCSK